MVHTSTRSRDRRIPDYRHLFVLTALGLAIFVRPFVIDSVAGVAVFDLLLLITIFAGVLATARSQVSRIILGGLAVTTGLMQFAWWFSHDPHMLDLFLTLAPALYILVACQFVRSLFESRDVFTGDRLAGAISAYLLLGLAWALLYVLLERAEPGSFQLAGTTVGETFGLSRFVGFSFITLTTLGYGNITPVTPKADALATSEALVGQLFVAVVIARMVAGQSMGNDKGG